ncbi:nucleotide exchange factor GrpE [Rhodomicrobium sp. Az07]|uniref:nucleotide exchange factor GrpE n=1 Tax=Rhodomicrobium sp. Az07 TaxID=2839034 RepID=UPI001BE7285A|nr:nucleotide exchange factor GrpE [Rhodomicrobium sp. Az07]MBT3070990.1 nucleotide exchange factor GrpE [Rhodomicrobium sp. Az07]
MNDTPDGPSDANGPENSDSLGRDQNPPATEEQVKALAQMLADVRAENTDLKDKHLRLLAEMENYRRRSEREKAETAKYASSEFGKDAIGIADNLRRAIEAAQKEAASDQTPALKTLLEGVEVTERELLKVFERHGITRFEPLGEKFDPHTSEAMIKVDVPNVPADVVVQVLQAGYKIGERVLRPAAVIVAKGGSPVKPVPPQDEHSAEPVSAPSAAHAEPHHDHHAVEPAHEHDPDVFRDPTGAPQRRDRHGADKRASSVTQPVTENSGPAGVDDLISSFGKRLENGN